MSEFLQSLLRGKYVGKNLYGREDEIEQEVKSHGYTLNLQDPEVNHSNIDVNTKRVNMMVVDGKITKVSIG